MRVLFFDIDGTLIDPYHGVPDIPASVMEQLERLHARGHKLVLCSGRPPRMISEKLRPPVFEAIVAFNGGMVDVEGKTIFQELLGADLAREGADLFEELGCDYMLETAHHIYLDPRFHELADYFEPRMGADFFTRDFDREEVFTRTLKIEANVLDVDRDRVLAAAQGRMGVTFNIGMHGTENAFEYYAPTISKARGIACVLDYYGADAADAIGIGDGANDLEMIRVCGTGVAMGNAVDVVKAEADLIIGKVTEDGLAQYLRTID